MIYEYDLRKVLAYVMIIFIMFISSGSSDFANDKNLAIGGWVFFSVVHFYFEKQIEYKFFALLGIFGAISVLYFILNGDFNQVTYIGFFIKIVLAYYCRNLCKEDFFDFFVNIIYVWACICLVLYGLQLISFDIFFNLNSLFYFEAGIQSKSSSMIFTMVPIHIVRNCGFMWEPGAYVSVLLITFYLNLFNREEPLFSRKNSVFLISILTTQSTMGILALLIPLSLLLKEFTGKSRAHQKLSVIVIPSVLIVFFTIFTQTDFLYKKMVSEILDLDEELGMIEKGIEEDFVISLSRSASVLSDIQTIQKYPLLGLGVDMRTVGFKKLGYYDKLETSCGTTILLLRFGFIGLIIYNFLLYSRAAFDRVSYKIGWVLLINYALFTQEISAGAFFHLFVF